MTVREFELIDEAKKKLEAACPSTVSCADIITLATRDSVALAGGPKYAVPTGRRDGLISNPNDANQLPGPASSVEVAFRVFNRKGLTRKEMVTLLGAHTVGFAHCNFFQDRLSNFEGTGAADPSMDSRLVSKLIKVCRTGSNPKTFLDQNTSSVFDNEFYNQIQLKKGILQFDQELALDSTTAGFVSGFASNRFSFSRSFADAMVKMSRIEVLSGKTGEIRRNCRVFNPRPKAKSPSRNKNIKKNN